MRCPDCCKFVGLTTEEPDDATDGIEVTVNDDGINLSATAEVPRNCADCGTELKRGSFDMETDIDADEVVEAAPEAIREEVRALLAEGELAAEVTDGTAEVEEGGGGRYAKNMIMLTLHPTLTVTRSDGEKFSDGSENFTIDAEMTGELAAGDFEEQV